MSVLCSAHILLYTSLQTLQADVIDLTGPEASAEPTDPKMPYTPDLAVFHARLKNHWRNSPIALVGGTLDETVSSHLGPAVPYLDYISDTEAFMFSLVCRDARSVYNDYQQFKMDTNNAKWAKPLTVAGLPKSGFDIKTLRGPQVHFYQPVEIIWLHNTPILFFPTSEKVFANYNAALDSVKGSKN